MVTGQIMKDGSSFLCHWHLTNESESLSIRKMNIEDLRTYESIAMTLQSVSDSVRDVRLGRANQMKPHCNPDIEYMRGKPKKFDRKCWHSVRVPVYYTCWLILSKCEMKTAVMYLTVYVIFPIVFACALVGVQPWNLLWCFERLWLATL